MKKTMKKGLQKATAILLSAIMVLSVFAMMSADLFKASAEEVSFDDRLELDFNNNWKFNLGDVSASYSKAYNDSAWETVNLPHDFSISQDFTTNGTEVESGNLPGGIGWYRKMFTMPTESRGKSIILNFDGAYNHTYVYVNGTLVGENHYGYNSFSFDISNYLVYGNNNPNLIAVKVENNMPSSRWYSGSGIYRDVTMTIADPVHVDLYGTYVTMPNLASTNGADGTLNAEITLTNADDEKAVTVEAQILDANGVEVGTAASTDVTVRSGVQTVVTLQPILSNPTLWDTDNPYLYTLRTTVSENGTAIDIYDTTIGYRYINWDLDGGFSLNGDAVKLQGVCMHHDQGALGAIQTYDALYRQVAILKDMGCNTIRTSHNTASRVFMEICNEMGILVMVEFFDGWDSPKNGNDRDFSEYFSDEISGTNQLLGKESGQMWYEFVLTQTVKRDRNDPSVIIWDCGNELRNATSSANYMTIAANTKNIMDALDTTRPLTQGNNQQNVMDVDEYMSVIGGNYYPSSWANRYSALNGKPFVLTETASALGSRGYYTNSGSGADDTTMHINAYDTTTVDWGTVAAEAWYYTIVNDWFSGEYVWTGFDYIGEPTPYNNLSSGSSTVPNSSYFGIIDTAGFGKDSYYLYRSWWNDDSTTLHLVPGTWNEDDVYVDGSGYVDVAVYSNADRIELLLDGDVIATATARTTTTSAGHSYQTWTESVTNSSYATTSEFYTGTGKDLYPQFAVRHDESQTLSVKAYDASGNEITDTVGTKSVSAVETSKIVATPWADATTKYTADSDSYIYIEYEAQDENGNFDNDYNGTLSITVNGEGATIVGVDNGDPTTTDKYQQDTVLLSDSTAKIQMFNGRALAVLRTTEDVADIEITTTDSNGNPIDGLTVTSSVAETEDELTDEFEEVIPQSEIEYEPTIYDEYQFIYESLTGSGSSANAYVLYSASSDAASRNYLPDGEYIITGAATNNAATGAMTHDTHSQGNGFTADGSSGRPSSGADKWMFERQSDGKYYIYYNDNGTNYYMNIGTSDSSLTKSTTPQSLDVTLNSDGTVIIGSAENNRYINYYGQYTNYVALYMEGTALTLYTVPSADSTPTITVEQADSITSGNTYIITTQSGSVLNHNRTSSGGTTTPPSADSDAWVIASSGNYYTISYDDNGTTRYLSIGSSVTTTTSSTTTRFADTNLSDGARLRNASGTARYLVVPTSAGSVSSTRTQNSGTTLYFWEVSGAGSGGVTQFVPSASGTAVPPVDDGKYVIYNDNSGIIFSGESMTYGSNSGIAPTLETPVNDTITTEPSNAYTFTHKDDGAYNEYYIQNADGQYLTIGSSNGKLTFSDTAQSVYVYDRADGTVSIYNGNQFIDYYALDGEIISTYSSSTSGANDNEIFALYRNTSGAGAVDVPANKADLYAALQQGVTHEPGNYSASSYQAFFNELKAGYDVFNDADATDDEIASATQAILNGIAGLGVDVKRVPATIFKYGYAPDSSTPYAGGGAAFNEQTYASMEEIIRADDNLMSQIKEIIGYDTREWDSSNTADEALDIVVQAYAKIYSIAFTGRVVTGGTELGEDDYYYTAWNIWTKSNTTGSAESSDEGASVQGLFSALLEDGVTTDHAAYDVLPYGNISNDGGFNTESGFDISITDADSTESVNLPALEGISVHINDVFKRENVLANNSSTEYSKFYWDLEFPFIETTNKYGISTYTYSSSSTDYVFQATYHDDTNTATANLVPVDTWSINRQNKGSGTGFFPFNYQTDATSVTGESAIYHYGMSFTTDFYIPAGGTYTDGQDVVFSFSGDDDVLVYVDDVLVLDNGGIHGARAASINFTDASINYQFAMDVTEGTVKSTTEYGTTYTYGVDEGYNGDTLAALEKLNEVRTDGEHHTFTFYYLERGSTDSNCEIQFNLQQASEYVLLNDETLVIDYGLPVEYNISENDQVDSAVANQISYSYEGIMEANQDVESVVVFNEPDNLVDTFASTTEVLKVQGLKYGTATIKGDGLVTYTPNTINMTGRDYFYTCAAITGDPTYTSDTVYYQYDRAIFIPATSIYYEDNFGAEISFTDGEADGSTHGVWEVVGDESVFANAKQAADLAGSDTANPYGFDPVYAGADETKDYTQYSGFSAHKVTVSAANNTNKGGTNPTVEFTFTGTGFDVLSMTDNTTGVFYMEIFDESGTRVGKRNVVDTYYGYSYGQLYADANGEATLDETDTPLYKSAKNEAVTKEPAYYSTDDTGATIITTEPSYLDVSGVGYTDTATYYDAEGKLTTTETDNVAYAYAYAYGWVTDSDSEGLYQIPVIKKTGLDYGTYRVVITPMYTAMFDHTGTGQFDLYVDAIRIYDPAGKDDGVDSSILTEYKYDNESYPNYLELKDMLIGADSLSEDASTQGIVFIDGIAALDNDLEKLKLAGPNNELYLAKDQAVAFEIWASAVPDEVQIGMKSAHGTPKFTVTYDGNSANQEIKTATEMNYIINSILPTGGKLTWSEVTVGDNTYYRTNTVVIQNTSADDSILAITSLKWTFTGVGQYGHYETNATETAAVMSLMASEATVSDAYTMINANATVDDDVTDDNAGAEIIPGDNEDTNDTNDEYQEELSFIQRIIRAIINFFKKILGIA